MTKLTWFLVGCLAAFPAYLWGYGRGLDWARRLYTGKSEVQK